MTESSPNIRSSIIEPLQATHTDMYGTTLAVTQGEAAFLDAASPLAASGMPEALSGIDSLQRSFNHLLTAQGLLQETQKHMRAYAKALGWLLTNDYRLNHEDESVQLPSIRRDYMTAHGFTLFTHVNGQMNQDVAARTIPRLPGSIPESKAPEWGTTQNGHTNAIVANNPAGTGLFLAMRSILHTVPRTLPKGSEGRYGITYDDNLRSGDLTTNNGFADLDFTWHFSCGVANAVADFFVANGVISQQQKDNFTLTDWANILRTGWFSNLTHKLALTSNGVYGQFGMRLEHYGNDSFYYAVQKNMTDFDLGGSNLFKLGSATDKTDGRTYATATLTPKFLGALRSSMQRAFNSAGCPVARNSVQLDREQLREDPHLQALIDAGTVGIVEERSDEKHIRVMQDHTAIDNTLLLVADQLATYDKTHGTPTARYPAPNRQLTIDHQRKEPVNAL